MSAAVVTDNLMPPDQRRWGGPMVLALFAHGLLVAALTWGISWNRHAPVVVAEAELWSAMPRSAAPRLIEEAPEPPPPEPTPPVREAPPPPPPPDPAIAQRDADIALAQQKKREQEKIEQQRLEAARLKAERDKQIKEKERQEAEKQARLKAEREKADKLAKEQKAKEDALKQAKLDREKAAREKAESEKADKALQAELARQRAENLKRMAGLAGATGAANATGTDKQSSGPSASYAGRIVGAVRPNIVFTETPVGNPAAEVEVRTLPDGTIAARRILRSSGVPAWDEAVLKALDRTAKLPRDTDGRVPATLNILFRPRD